MLHRLLEAYGFSNRRAAQESGVSATSIARYIEGDTPNVTNAAALANLFDNDDAAALLDEWGYLHAAEKVRTTHDPEVANGWRLDTLIAEIRQTNKILNRIEQHLAPKTHGQVMLDLLADAQTEQPMPEETEE